MEAVPQQAGLERPPWLQSAAALIGIAVLVGLSIFVGVRYWWPRDQALAILTIGAELIAFAGLGVAAWQWSRSRKHALGAGLVTIIAAAWCGFTMFQNIEAETRAEAVRLAQERPAYIFAANAAHTAQTLLTSRLTHPNPRPTCTCPQTLAQWEAAEAGAIDRLRNERDSAVAQMERAIPEPQTDWIALGRGIGVEIAKLFGFAVFALMLGPPRRRHRPGLVEPPTITQPHRPFEVVDGGLADGPSTIARPHRPPSQPLRLGHWSALKALWFGVIGSTIAGPTQPALQPPSTSSTSPLNHPAERVVESTAAPIWRDDLPKVARELAATMGERRIATTMSRRFGEQITRYQVRIWLGREHQAAA